jgi:hypothetical protein
MRFQPAFVEVNGGKVALTVFWAILYARFIGNPSYLPPIRSLIEIHCRNDRGVYPYWLMNQPNHDESRKTPAVRTRAIAH